MHKRSAYYVSNPEYQVKFIGNGTRIEPRATRAVAWLTFNEAKDLRNKGWIVNLKDGPTEEGIGPVKEETDISVSWDDIENKPDVIAAGENQEAARTAIGAGTSNLAIGATSDTAKAGDWKPSWSDVENKPVGTSVADATAGTEVTTINALLASLRTAGFIE